DLWNVAERRLIRRLDADAPPERLRLPRAFSPDGEHVLVEHIDSKAIPAGSEHPPRAILWNVASGRHVKRFTAPGLSALAASADLRFVALRIGEAGFRIWDVETGRIEELPDLHATSSPAPPRSKP